MSGVAPQGIRYRFGPFELDTGENELSRNGARIRVQDLPFRLLAMLLERPGEIVTREEVRHRLWPDNTFVEFDNSLGVAVRKVRDALNDNPETPRYVETLPRRGYRFLAPVTVLVAEPPSQSAAIAEPGSTQVGNRNKSVLTETRPYRLLRRGLVGLIGLLLAGAIVYALRFQSLRRPRKTEVSSLAPLVLTRRSVAVLGFRNLPGRADDDWLSPAFSEMLTTELAADGTLRMVPGEDIARVKRELPLADEDSLGQATLNRLRTNPGADTVVLGSYTTIAGHGNKRIRLDVRVQDTVRGEIVTERSFTGDERSLFELATRAGQALRRSLGINFTSGEASSQARAALPTNQEAMRYYAAGQERLWAFDYVHARDLLVKATARDPGYPLAHAALSEAWSHLGYAVKARAEGELAHALSTHLRPEEQLLIEGEYDSILQDRPRAIEVFRKLYTQFPDNLDYGLRLADEQRWINPQDSLQTLDALRRLPPPKRDDPRIDMGEARAWMNQDFVKAQAAARRAVEKGSAEGAGLLVARAFGILCQTQGNGSSTSQTIADCEHARHSFAAAGDRNNEARTLNDFAGLYYQMGDLGQAERMFREAISVFRKIGDIEGVTVASSNLGDISLARGDLAGAARALSDAVPGYNAMGDKDGVALTLNDLGEVARRRGNLEAALATYREARTTADEIDDKSAVAHILAGVGDVEKDRGDLGAARKSYEESLTLRRQTGEKQGIAETELALALLSLEEGHPGDAENVIRRCKEQFHQDHTADDELSAGIALMDVLVAEGKYGEAAIEEVAQKRLATSSTNQLILFQLDLSSGRIDLASGNLASSRLQLEHTLENAKAHHLLGLELEARLALMDLQKKSGQGSAGRTRLASVEKLARNRGFGLIATKAQSLDGEDKKKSP